MVTDPVCVTIVAAPPGHPAATDRLVARVREAGLVVPLAAPPIHAPEPLRIQALTGRGCGEMAVFDDWRPDAYAAVPVGAAGRPSVSSIVDAAREAGIAILDRIPDPLGLPGSAIVQVPDAAELETGALHLSGSGTTVWIFPCAVATVQRVLNPNALLAATGLLEVDPAGRPDWSRSLAYHVGHGQLWVNLRGREPRGVVQPGAEYDEVRAALRAVIRERLTDEASDEPLAQVLLKEEAYEGPWLWRAPDLVLVPAPGCGFSRAAVAGAPDGPAVRRQPGVAYRPGWWGVTGPQVQREDPPAALDILSVAPTVAAILGFPIPHRVSGRVWAGQLTDGFWAPRRAAVEAEDGALSPEEERILTHRLRDLGYIE